MKKLSAPLVSIIMPAYNAEKTIEESINSVIKQSFESFELIVIDDRSTDNTINIVRRISSRDSRIKLIPLDCNKGVYNARNIGIREATGDYIAFLDSDDLWDERKLEIQVEVLSSGVLCCHSSYYRFKNDKAIVGIVNAPKMVKWEDMISGNKIGNLTGIYNARKLGKFYQKDIKHEDYDMWISILSKTDSTGIQDVLAYYRISSDSLSSNKLKAVFWTFNVMSNRFSSKIGKFRVYLGFVNYLLSSLWSRR